MPNGEDCLIAFTSAGLAALLCEKCVSESVRAQESFQRVDCLSAEVGHTEALCDCTSQDR